jgi:hypothetical protein
LTVGGNTDSNQVNWLTQIGTLKRNVIYDTDGSLSNPFLGHSKSGAIVYGFTHITQNAGCSLPLNTNLWDNAVFCSSPLIVRRVTFANLLIKQNFKSQQIHVAQIDDITDFVPANTTSDQYTSTTSFDPSFHM